jgi:hypothetical protein
VCVCVCVCHRERSGTGITADEWTEVVSAKDKVEKTIESSTILS